MKLLVVVMLRLLSHCWQHGYKKLWHLKFGKKTWHPFILHRSVKLFLR